MGHPGGFRLTASARTGSFSTTRRIGYWPRSSGPGGYVATLNFFACAAAGGLADTITSGTRPRASHWPFPAGAGLLAAPSPFGHADREQNPVVGMPASTRITSRSAKGPAGPLRTSSTPQARPPLVRVGRDATSSTSRGSPGSPTRLIDSLSARTCHAHRPAPSRSADAAAEARAGPVPERSLPLGGVTVLAGNPLSRPVTANLAAIRLTSHSRRQAGSRPRPVGSPFTGHTDQVVAVAVAWSLAACRVDNVDCSRRRWSPNGSSSPDLSPNVGRPRAVPPPETAHKAA
jgi:hypothetical protein